MELTLSEIAKHLDGDVVGDSSCLISGVSEIQSAEPNTITFLGNPMYQKYLKNTNAAAILVADPSLLNGGNGIVVGNPQLAMARTLALFTNEKEIDPTIHPKAVIAKNAQIGDKVNIDANVIIEGKVRIGDRSSIGANTVIGSNTALGEDCSIASNVSIYEGIILGNNVTVHSGTVIGSDGFGYIPVDDSHEKIPQTGNVVIGDHVEIGSNCSIDRATIGSTIISEMTKIDNLVHIAHNVKIGENCIIAGQVGFAGSSTLGNNVMIGGQAGISGHLKIGNNVKIGGGSGVIKNIPDNSKVMGYPAKDLKNFIRENK